MSISGQVLNDVFVRRLDTDTGKSKTAAYTETFIRDRLREESFYRKFNPIQKITRAECQRSVNHDTLVKIVDIEPSSRAVAISFRAQPRAMYIKAPRYEIPFFTISSLKWSKTVQELAAYEMPVTKIIEQNSVKDLQEIEDRQALLYLEMCVQALQYEKNGNNWVAAKLSNQTLQGATPPVESSIVKGEGARNVPLAGTDFIVQPLLKQDLSSMFRLFVGHDGVRLRCDRFVLTDWDFEEVMLWTVEVAGSKVVSETTVDGYKYGVVVGRKFVRTVKTDILRPGNLYAITKPEFHGRFYILNPVKFWIDKKANRITFQCWEDIGMGIGNVASVRKLELYAGSVTTSQTDPGFEIRIPKAQDDLGAVNNRAAQGTYFPRVYTY